MFEKTKTFPIKQQTESLNLNLKAPTVNKQCAKNHSKQTNVHQFYCNRTERHHRWDVSLRFLKWKLTEKENKTTENRS